MEQFWSKRLARELLEQVPREQVLRLAAPHRTDFAETDDILDLVAAFSLRDTNLRRQIADSWRAAHEDVVTAAQLLSVEVSDPHCQAIIRHFGATAVLLEQVTENLDNASFVIDWLLQSVSHPEMQAELEEVVARWRGDDDGAPIFTVHDGAPLRLVIFGGHVRDGKKMQLRLFDASPFDVCWRPFEKGQTSQNVRAVSEAMGRADAVLVVTSMVSHTLMRVVKRVATEQDIPFRTVSKATDAHLLPTLREVFPQHFADKPVTG